MQAIEEMKVVGLKQELEKRGLDCTGVKSVLVERLRKEIEKENEISEDYPLDDTDGQELIDEYEGNDYQDEVIDDNGTDAEHPNEEEIRVADDDSIKFMLDEDDKLLEEMIYDDATSAAENKERRHTAKTEENSDSGTSFMKKESANAQEKSENDSTKSATGKDEGRTSIEKSIGSSNRSLWVSGLASTTRAQDLKTLFSKEGKVLSAKIVTNAKTPGAKCFGFVTMQTSEEAAKCVSEFNNTELLGRLIQVEKAKGEPGVSSKSSTNKSSHENDKKDTGMLKEHSSSDRQKSSSKEKDIRSHSQERHRRSGEGERQHVRDRLGSRHNSPGPRAPHRRDVLSFNHIMEERERHRMRMRDRMLREEERRREEMRRRDIERRQREEAMKLKREREKLERERERLEREKIDLMRLERENQRLEREKLEREREELRKMQMKYGDSHRPLKRTPDDRDYGDFRKRPAGEPRGYEEEPRRFEGRPSHRGGGGGNSRGGGRPHESMRGMGGPPGNERYEDRRDRDRERRPIDRVGPRAEERNHRGAPPQPPRDRPRETWKENSGGKGSFVNPSNAMMGNMSSSISAGRSSDTGGTWRSSRSGDRWGGPNPNMNSSGSGIDGMIHHSNTPHHIPPNQIGSMPMGMMPAMQQSERYINSFR